MEKLSDISFFANPTIQFKNGLKNISEISIILNIDVKYFQLSHTTDFTNKGINIP